MTTVMNNISEEISMDEKRVTITSTAKFTAEAARDNPNLGWLDFVLTDNQPNANQQGIKKDGFASLVSTGLLMPLKMAKGRIEPGHAEAEPLGTIASLEEEVNEVLGKAAIWKDDRSSDYDLLKTMSSEGDPINISWELAYTKAETDETGVMWILDPVLLAATIVGIPAYGGRTPVISVASTEGGTMDEELNDSPQTVIEPEPEPTPDPEPEPEVASEPEPDENVDTLLAELTTLREYKETREREDAESALLSTRLQALTEAGFEYTEKDLKENKELWLSMPDVAFAAMLEVMISLNTAAATASTSGVPDVSGSPPVATLDVVRRGLQEMKEKRE